MTKKSVKNQKYFFLFYQGEKIKNFFISEQTYYLGIYWGITDIL